MQQEPAAIDYRRTARRLPWDRLPAPVQDNIAAHLGGRVGSVLPAGGGFTPGFAAVLGDDAGESVFAKAAPASDPNVYRSYRREAEVTALMPPGMPVPALRTAERLPVDGVEWQVLVYDAVAGRMPGLPWTEADVAAVERACAASAALLTDFPRGARGSALGEDMAQIPSQFQPVLDGAAPPWFLPGLDRDEAHELQRALELSVEALAGDGVIHGDLRGDNILIASGNAVFCDWNFLGTGAAWIDWVGLLPYTRPDGIDADAWLHRSALTRDVPPAHIDAWLAALLNFMTYWGGQPEDDASPQLRSHGRYTARLLYDWLAARRG
ncbi:Phosphotransferase enzyme family protein [Arthrobacter saudimassiliensis]|uniref:Phosphotransferase enzyme family protein n=1 Tax=Arthrobacter saudimassiliensis TaxID=1461584 RepID=A0A078MVC3_9MICC|nr:Phosphotransferase enzyme family protein [Arthrobacter saudimassiliensis]